MMLFNKKYPRLILVISFIVLIATFLIFIYYYDKPVDYDNLNTLLYKKIESRQIKSIVIRKSIDYSNHGATYIVYGRDSLPTHTGWEEKINIGDSIIKPKGSLTLIIKSIIKIDSLNYEDNKEEILTTNF